MLEASLNVRIWKLFRPWRKIRFGLHVGINGKAGEHSEIQQKGTFLYQWNKLSTYLWYSYQSLLSWCWYPWQGWWWVFVLFFSKGLSYNRLLQILGGLTLLGNMCQPLRHVMKNDRMLSSGAEWIRLRGTAST